MVLLILIQFLSSYRYSTFLSPVLTNPSQINTSFSWVDTRVKNIQFIMATTITRVVSRAIFVAGFILRRKKHRGVKNDLLVTLLNIELLVDLRVHN